MKNKWLSACIFIFGFVYILNIQIGGDGYEYFLTTHAFYSHGSPEIKSDDVLDYINLIPEEGRKPFVSREILIQLNSHIRSDKPTAAVGFYPAIDGQFYAMHFWIYSLLALPFYAVLKFFNINPVWAFGFLNMSFLGGVFYYLKKSFPDYQRQAFSLFFVMGTVFYLRWTGPEVMSASCVFIACIAILRAEIALAICMCGLGASQNPSIIFMMPFSLGYGIFIHRWPQFACFEKTPSRPNWRSGLMALSGIIFGLMSYAFFQWKFDTPSVIAQYGSYPSLISTDRLFSLLFDLNQGMVVGLPGLVCVLVPGFFIADSLQRVRWLMAALLLMIITLVMAVPTLSTGNWNPGGLVMLRYNYWLGMPLLVLLILGLTLIPKARAKFIFGLALVLQGMVFFGQVFEKSNNTQHTPLARWVLKKFPSFYNPEAEIFYERSIGSEKPYTIDLEYLYGPGGHPLKLLRHWSNSFGAQSTLCPVGSLLQGNKLREVGQGWQYLHPPFRCGPVNSDQSLRVWRIRAAQPNEHTILSKGWAVPEQDGVWSDHVQSTLTLKIPAGLKAKRIRFKGQYYGSQRTSTVTLNGRSMGRINLANGEFAIPADLAQKESVQVVLQHPDAVSPKSRGESPDARLLGFYLEAVSVD